MAVETIRRQYTDINECDIVTGEYVGPKELTERTKKHLEKTQKEFQEKVAKSNNGTIEIAGFGMVQL